MLDYVLMDRHAKKNVIRGEASRMSNHYMVEAKVKICRGFPKTKNNMSKKRVVKVKPLEKDTGETGSG